MVAFKNSPVVLDIRFEFFASFIVVIVTGVASVLGLLYPDELYPTEELIQAFLANDVVNLAIGLPVLLVSLWLVRSSKLIGLLLWPGALFYMAYNYLIYLIAMPLNAYYAMFPIIVISSCVLAVLVLRKLNGRVILENLTGKVPERFAGGVLVGFGIIFIVRVIVLVIDVYFNNVMIPITEVALHIADVFFSFVLLICGVQLWRRKRLGYLTGLGLLFQASMLFIALIILMIIQPFLIEAVIPWFDVVVVFVMGFIAFVPFIMYIKGVMVIDHKK